MLLEKNLDIIEKNDFYDFYDFFKQVSPVSF